MSKRHSMSRGYSRADFTKKASKVHPFNSLNPRRGGIRT